MPMGEIKIPLTGLSDPDVSVSRVGWGTRSRVERRLREKQSSNFVSRVSLDSKGVIESRTEQTVQPDQGLPPAPPTPSARSPITSVIQDRREVSKAVRSKVESCADPLSSTADTLRKSLGVGSRAYDSPELKPPPFPTCPKKEDSKKDPKPPKIPNKPKKRIYCCFSAQKVGPDGPDYQES